MSQQKANNLPIHQGYYDNDRYKVIELLFDIVEAFLPKISGQFLHILHLVGLVYNFEAQQGFEDIFHREQAYDAILVPDHRHVCFFAHQNIHDFSQRLFICYQDKSFFKILQCFVCLAGSN